jgi:hypothetical protein
MSMYNLCLVPTVGYGRFIVSVWQFLHSTNNLNRLQIVPCLFHQAERPPDRLSLGGRRLPLPRLL